jgi:hypothetical protein
MKPQPGTREQQKISPNPDFKSAAKAPKIPSKKNRKPNKKNYAANDTLRTACKQVINELRVKKKGRGGFFLFFALFFACASGLFGKLLCFWIVGAISDLNRHRIRSRTLQIRFPECSEFVCEFFESAFECFEIWWWRGDEEGGAFALGTVFFLVLFCFLALNCGLWCFFVFVVSRVCHCVWWVMHVFMSPVPYARLALKAGEFIEHCGGNCGFGFFIKAKGF